MLNDLDGWDLVHFWRQVSRQTKQQIRDIERQNLDAAKDDAMQLFNEACVHLMRHEIHLARDNHAVPVNWQEYDEWRKHYNQVRVE